MIFNFCYSHSAEFEKLISGRKILKFKNFEVFFSWLSKMFVY